MRKRRHEEPCVYCGASPARTRDHVPPAAVFGRPRPANLITVPCCEGCRRSQSLDDEYFRDMLGASLVVARHPAGAPLVDGLHRALERQRGSGSRGSTLRGFELVEVFTPGGIFVGKAGIYRPETARLDAVVSRTMRGLYFHHYGRRLPPSGLSVAYTLSAFTGPMTNDVRFKLERVVEQARQGEARTLGAGAVVYRHQSVASETGHATLWHFTFYGSIEFFGFTATPDLGRSESPGAVVRLRVPQSPRPPVKSPPRSSRTRRPPPLAVDHHGCAHLPHRPGSHSHRLNSPPRLERVLITPSPPSAPRAQRPRCAPGGPATRDASASARV